MAGSDNGVAGNCGESDTRRRETVSRTTKQTVTAEKVGGEELSPSQEARHGGSAGRPQRRSSTGPLNPCSDLGDSGTGAASVRDRVSVEKIKRSSSVCVVNCAVCSHSNTECLTPLDATILEYLGI